MNFYNGRRWTLIYFIECWTFRWLYMNVGKLTDGLKIKESIKKAKERERNVRMGKVSSLFSYKS
jgi:hypothetical protein